MGGCFDCSENQLEDLKYIPESIYGYLDFSMNKIKTLKYFPENDGLYGAKSIADAKRKLGYLKPLAERLKDVHREMASDLIPKMQPVKRTAKKRRRTKKF